MGHILSRDTAKAVVSLLREKQPRTFDDIKDTLGMREFEVRKLLKSLQLEKVLVMENLSGKEKYWLNDEMAVDFLGRDVTQRRRLKHKKGRKGEADIEMDDPSYV